jgi:hypothetical protein
MRASSDDLSPMGENPIPAKAAGASWRLPAEPNPNPYLPHGVGVYELAAMAWGDSLGLGATRRSFAEPDCAPADGRQAPPYPPGSLRQAVQQSRGDDACALYRAAEVCCRCIGLTCLSPPALLTAVPVHVWHFQKRWARPLSGSAPAGRRRTYGR